MDLALVIICIVSVLCIIGMLVAVIIFLRYCNIIITMDVKNLTENNYIELTLGSMLLYKSDVFTVYMYHDKIKRIETEKFEITITKDNKVKFFRYYSCKPSYILEDEDELKEFEKFKKEFYKRYKEATKNKTT